MEEAKFVRVLHLESSKTFQQRSPRIESSIKFAVRLLQLFFRQTLSSLGYGDKTFTLEECNFPAEKTTPTTTTTTTTTTTGPPGVRGVERDFVLKRWMVDVRLHDKKPKTIWKDLANDVVKSDIYTPGVKWLAIGSVSTRRGINHIASVAVVDKYQVEEPVVAQGSGNLALVVFRHVETWPQNVAEFRQTLKRNDDDDDDDNNSSNKISKRQYGHNLGVILHELCHTFDLCHAPSGIMNRDFDDLLDSLSYSMTTTTTTLDDENESSSSIVELSKRLFGVSTFTDESLFVLSHHAWFHRTDISTSATSTSSSSSSSSIAIDGCDIRLVTAAGDDDNGGRLGIILVQICVDEMVVKHIEMKKGNPKRFSLTREDLFSVEGIEGREEIDLLVMDDRGRVFKKCMKVYDIYMNKRRR